MCRNRNFFFYFNCIWNELKCKNNIFHILNVCICLCCESMPPPPPPPQLPVVAVYSLRMQWSIESTDGHYLAAANGSICANAISIGCGGRSIVTITIIIIIYSILCQCQVNRRRLCICFEFISRECFRDRVRNGEFCHPLYPQRAAWKSCQCEARSATIRLGKTRCLWQRVLFVRA